MGSDGGRRAATTTRVSREGTGTLRGEGLRPRRQRREFDGTPSVSRALFTGRNALRANDENTDQGLLSFLEALTVDGPLASPALLQTRPDNYCRARRSGWARAQCATTRRVSTLFRQGMRRVPPENTRVGGRQPLLLRQLRGSPSHIAPRPLIREVQAPRHLAVAVRGGRKPSGGRSKRAALNAATPFFFTPLNKVTPLSVRTTVQEGPCCPSASTLTQLLTSGRLERSTPSARATTGDASRESRVD